ncbi:MAG: hypothetical protein M0T69_03170 [Deltaproteobacteria bacterium]|nr:hypothetical protein [Deltaproteobacteria bacterium]
MTGFRSSRFLLVIATTLCLAAAAWAEGIFPVNDPGTGSWVFDQPSVVPNGTVLHLAFVGDNAAGADNASLNTRLYYAAVNGGADFTNKTTTRSQVLVTPAVAIDNGDAYTDARHPQIALLSATEAVILFQARPSDNTAAGSKLFLALVTIDNNTVTSQRVTEIRDAAGARIPGNLTDPSFGFVVSDNTLRMAFSSSPSLAAGSPYSDVYYARVGWDNALVVNGTILLNTAISAGVSALPRLKLDGNNYSHIAWAAETAAATSVIYYSMVKEVSPGVDNLAIGATSVLSGPYRWGFPNVLLPVASRVLVLAGVDSGTIGEPGYLGTAYLNPDAVTHDGNPVSVGNLIPGASFYVFPPGSDTPLSSVFSVYHPEASLDASNRVHVAGYGSATGAYFNAGTYFTMSLQGVTTTTTTTTTAGDIASLISPGVPVGTGQASFAMSLPGDYTRPAFVHFSGKSVQFWSGQDNVVTGSRNLYVTSALSSTDIPVPTKQSGCSMVDDPRRGEAGRIPGAAVLLLPAALLALRRAARKAFGRS